MSQKKIDMSGNTISFNESESLNHTPRGNRIHIGLFGRTNTGKSSIINALADQEVALVSAEKGTTTDPVYKAMEIHPLGPCVLMDTPGFDDDSLLGEQRIRQTKKILAKTDIAILLFTDDNIEKERQWIALFEEENIPFLAVINKIDLHKDSSFLKETIKAQTDLDAILVSATQKIGLDTVRRALTDLVLPEKDPSICGHLVSPEDVVILVMPQDIQAPKGRLILPQVQTIRDLLDNHCLVLSVTIDQFPLSLAKLKEPPTLIITDSQVFADVYAIKPPESILTSFSVLFSRYKGDISIFVEGAHALNTLKATDRVLIAEACSHNPLDGDIGRIKLPALLRQKIHPTINIDVVSGNNFPEDLSPYALVIHCGSCMFNRKHVLSRIRQATSQGIPITNYGMAIAHMNGILDKIAI